MNEYTWNSAALVPQKMQIDVIVLTAFVGPLRIATIDL